MPVTRSSSRASSIDRAGSGSGAASRRNSVNSVDDILDPKSKVKKPPTRRESQGEKAKLRTILENSPFPDENEDTSLLDNGVGATPSQKETNMPTPPQELDVDMFDHGESDQEQYSPDDSLAQLHDANTVEHDEYGEIPKIRSQSMKGSKGAIEDAVNCETIGYYNGGSWKYYLNKYGPHYRIEKGSDGIFDCEGKKPVNGRLETGEKCDFILEMAWISDHYSSSEEFWAEMDVEEGKIYARTVVKCRMSKGSGKARKIWEGWLLRGSINWADRNERLKDLAERQRGRYLTYLETEDPDIRRRFERTPSVGISTQKATQPRQRPLRKARS